MASKLSMKLSGVVDNRIVVFVLTSEVFAVLFILKLEMALRCYEYE